MTLIERPQDNDNRLSEILNGQTLIDLIDAAKKAHTFPEGDERVDFAFTNLLDQHPEYEEDLTDFLRDLNE